MTKFEELAAGASELRVHVQKGDISTAANTDRGWSLEWSSDAEEMPELERQGTAMIVRQRSSRMLKQRLDLRLTVPPDVQVVELRTGIGQVSAERVQGRLSLTTGNGPTVLTGARGNAEVITGNGEVSIQDFEGDLTANTGNGRVRIEQFSGRGTLHTGNGRIEVLDSSDRLRANTGNGDVVLTGVSGDVELNTGHGQVEINASRSLTVRASSAMGGVRIEGGTVSSLRLNTM
ncbi:MAG: DUF4097 family beta strand repeat-containing protein, partial [Chloroflexota bacterium]|nr:DUF4097 family beta strand repeat-containing protein [Chloroflexota bacterium]